MQVDCTREPEVLDALAAQRWPDRCDAELRAHVQACEVCADLAAVAGALLEDHDAAYGQARVPSAGLVWWRAQLRAREEDARAAARPIAFIQGVAASALVWGAVMLVRSIPRATFVAWTDWALELRPDVNVSLTTLAHTAAAVPMVMLLAGAALLLAPLAIYLAVNED